MRGRLRLGGFLSGLIDSKQAVDERIVVEEFGYGYSQPPAPVRMLVDRTRQVRHLGEREQIFQRV